jgi:hypothetical protein
MSAAKRFLTPSGIVGLVAGAAAVVGVVIGLYVTRDSLGFESDQRIVDAMNRMIQVARATYATTGRAPEAMPQTGSEQIRYVRLNDVAIELCGEFNWGDIAEPESVLDAILGPEDVMTYFGPPEGVLHNIAYRTRKSGRNCFVMDMRCDGYGIPEYSEDEAQCERDRPLEEAGKDPAKR